MLLARHCLPLVPCRASRLHPFALKCSIIRSTNQDGFIQRAIDASNAYASIIEAVKKAETAAADAADAASEALMVRSCPAW